MVLMYAVNYLFRSVVTGKCELLQLREEFHLSQL